MTVAHDPREPERAPIGDPPPDRFNPDIALAEGIACTVSAEAWRRRWGNRAAERRAANSPW